MNAEQNLGLPPDQVEAMVIAFFEQMEPYSFAVPEAVTRGEPRPLRNPDDADA